MSGGVVVVAEHAMGELADITLEMLACGRASADASRSGLTCLVLTDDARPFHALPLTADKTIVVQDPGLGSFNPQADAKWLGHLLKDLAPRLVLLGNTTVGTDLAGPLSVALSAPVVGNCIKVDWLDGKLVFTSKLYGGKLVARSVIERGSVLTLLMAGSYRKERGMKDAVAPIEVRPSPVSLEGLRIRFREFLKPEAADIDLTKIPILVCAGRGVKGPDNLKPLRELADLLRGAVCATRPVVDQGWLPRTRQVGRSGLIVKPRLYLALGVSGAPEHLEGMKDSELIVAVNTDPSAPIFDVADYGSTEDLLEVVPALVGAIRAMRGST